jgi:hypothetical protein
MNMHLDDGQLRAYLDGETGAAESAHLEQCSACQSRFTQIKGRASYTGQRLAFLALPQDASMPAARTALSRMKNQVNLKETFMLTRIFSPKFRPVWTALLVVVILAGAFSIPTVRASAVQFLGLFRVQQVTVLPVDISSLSTLTGSDTLGKELGQIVSSAVTVDQAPGNPTPAANASEASRAAGFTVRLPTTQAAVPQLTVQGKAAFHMVIDRARAQSFLNEAGYSSIVLPASVDGAKITVDIPASVTASYGTCPSASSEGDSHLSNSGTPGRRYADCVVLMQIPSPTVDAPPDLDVAQLVELGLQFTGMTPEQARAYSQTVDWTSTLVIPIPNNAAVYQQVSVDGVTGTLIQRPVDDAPQFALVWVKDGIIYAISGLGAGSTQAIDMANSMQ